MLATGDKTLVFLEADPWAGMTAPGPDRRVIPVTGHVTGEILGAE